MAWAARRPGFDGLRRAEAWRRRRWSALAGRTVSAFLVGALAGCSGGLFAPRGPIARAELTILYDSLGIMLAIIVPTIVATLAVAWWYRASNHRAKYSPDWQYSGRIELVVWSIPAMTILLLGGIGWIGSHTLDPFKPLPGPVEPLRIQAVSLDWKWLFILPDKGIASINRLVVPTGTPLSLELTSSGVMNGFMVPQLGSQVATMAGMTTRLHLEADTPGIYWGRSTQFSGDGFADMAFPVEAVPPNEFSRRIAAARGTGPVLDSDSYAELAKPGVVQAPLDYGSVIPGLFDRIVRLDLWPAGSRPAQRSTPQRE